MMIRALAAGRAVARKKRLRGSGELGAFRRGMIVVCSDTTTCPRGRLPHLRVVAGIFLAVDRADVRRIVIEIGAADAEFGAVFIDPTPEDFGRSLPQRARSAIGAHDVSRETMAVTATET